MYQASYTVPGVGEERPCQQLPCFLLVDHERAVRAWRSLREYHYAVFGAADLLALYPEMMDLPDLHLGLVPESDAGGVHPEDWCIPDQKASVGKPCAYEAPVYMPLVGGLFRAPSTPDDLRLAVLPATVLSHGRLQHHGFAEQ